MYKRQVTNLAHPGVALRTREWHDSPAASAFADRKHDAATTAFWYGNRHGDGHLDREQ